MKKLQKSFYSGLVILLLSSATAAGASGQGRPPKLPPPPPSSPNTGKSLPAFPLWLRLGIGLLGVVR
jgi:hypothetical protein